MGRPRSPGNRPSGEEVQHGAYRQGQRKARRGNAQDYRRRERQQELGQFPLYQSQDEGLSKASFQSHFDTRDILERLQYPVSESDD